MSFKVFKYNNKSIVYWVTGLDLTYLAFFKNFNFFIIKSNNYNSKNNLSIYFTENIYIYSTLFLKNMLTNLYANIDKNFLFNTKYRHLLSHFSCFLTNERITINTTISNKLKINSISSFFKSTQWTERELTEFNNIMFKGLLDSRRLLTDYTYNKNISNISYKTDSYDLIFQNIYIRVLHWFFLFLFFFITIMFSFIFFNKNLLHVLILSECLILLMVFMLLSLTVYYNIYYLIILSLILLILGGLELSVNFLIIMIKC